MSAVQSIGVELRVNPDALEANPWNPNLMSEQMYQKELASIRSFGFMDPITVRQLAADRYQIIDGEHRWRAAKQLGMTEVPIWNLGEVTDVVAKQMTIVLNETRGQSNPEKLGELLRDLLVSETTESLLATLPFDADQFESLAGIGDFDWSQLETKPDQEQEQTQWVERMYRMPLDAAQVLDQAIGRIRAGDEGILDWQALELLAADYLGGKQ